MGYIHKVNLSQPFPNTLARGLIERFPLAHDLARCLVLLPSRRACLFLQNAFSNLAVQSKTNLVLPKIVSLSDIEEGQSPLLIDPISIDSKAEDGVKKNPLSSLNQMGFLIHLVMNFQKSVSVQNNPVMAFDLTKDLMAFLDEVETGNVSLDQLEDLIPDHFAHHWQIILQFLNIIRTFYPKILEDHAKLDPSSYKRDNLIKLANIWQKNNPNYPVILAGTTGTRYGTLRLAQTILTLNQGHIVLPGFDHRNWPTQKALNPEHPQYVLHEFLKGLSVSRVQSDVITQTISSWVKEEELVNLTRRSELLNVAMGSDLCKAFEIEKNIFECAIEGVESIEAETVLEEARVIALILRKALEDKTASSIALVTPDRELVRRVKAELKRWDIVPNDSAGTPLTQTPVGQFLNLCASAFVRPNVSEFIALLKHPLCAKYGFKTKNGVIPRSQHIQFTRLLEMKYLRGVTHFSLHSLNPDLLDDAIMKGWLEHVMGVLRIASNIKGMNFLSEWIEVHIQLAKDLYGQKSDQLWTQEDGVEAYNFFQKLKGSTQSFPKFFGNDYIHFFKSLLSQVCVHPVEGLGHRIMILGTIEARHHNADIIILGSLNEGTWPKIIEADPWLNRAMRQQLGMPPAERKIGLSAHDFCVCFSARQVFLTRSRRQNGTDTIPSRFWQRLEAVLKSKNLSLIKKETPWLEWCNAFDGYLSLHKDQLSSKACPPLEHRPRTYSLTDIQMLINDPYVLYAKKILALAPLKPFHGELDNSDRGILLHKILELYLKDFTPGHLLTREELGRIGEEFFKHHKHDPLVQSFWRSRFEYLADWIYKELDAKAPFLEKIYTEVPGKMNVMTNAGPVTITGKADRIDQTKDGGLHIIDYKTGIPPTGKELENFTAPQLPLEALIASRTEQEEGFENLPKKPVEEISFWHITGGAKGGEISTYYKMDNLLSNTQEALLDLLNHYLSNNTAYISTGHYEDYLSLSRVEK